MDILVCWTLLLATVGLTTASTGSQYEWYDAKGGAGRGDDGAAGAASDTGVYSDAAATAGSTDALVSELLSHGSKDDGLTLDLFHNLQQYAESDKTQSGEYSDDMMAQILAEAAKSSGSSYGGFTSSGDDDSSEDTDSAFAHLKAAANIYAVAQAYAKDADRMLSQAQDDLDAAGSDEMADAANSAKGAALATIAAAKAEARANVVKSRNAYVSSLDDLKNRVTVMKMIEKRFRALALAFSKVREYAGQALLSLKSMTAAKKDDYSSKGGYGYSHPKENILTTVATAKARIAKMKVVEKRFLALAKALAKVRAQAFAGVRAVRKNAVGLAKTTTASQAHVGAAVEAAASIVSQAVATARATALAKAEATAVAAIDSKSKSEAIVHAAANVVESARAQAVEQAAPSLAKKAEYGAGYGGDDQKLDTYS